MTIEQISYELDRCFEELQYKNDEHPFEHGWREDGVPASMVVQFCKRQAAREMPLKCFIYHRGRKTFEYSPANSTAATPVVSMAIWGYHAYFYQCGKANNVASQNNLDISKDYSEFARRRVRDLYTVSRTPLFSTWKEEDDFQDHLITGFETLATKKRKSMDDSPLSLCFKEGTDMEKRLAAIRYFQEKFKGTGQAFGVEPQYGASTDHLSSISISARDCPPIKVCRVHKDSEVLDRLTTQIQKTMDLDSPFEYRGETVASFGEKLRLAVSKHRRDISQQTKAKILKRQHDCCAICKESLARVEFDHKTPLADGGGNGEENVQALCPPCHAEKSRSERLTSFGNAGYSIQSSPKTSWKA